MRNGANGQANNQQIRKVRGENMATQADLKRIDSILAKIETLQNATSDRELQDRLQSAKSELLRYLNR